MAQIEPSVPGWNRFDGLSRPAAAAVLAVLALLMLLGFAGGGSSGSAGIEGRVTSTMSDRPPVEGMVGDHALYLSILRDVEAGEPYYEAAAREQRANHYPLRPFVTVRLPTLAHIFAATGLTGGVLLVAATGLAAIIAWRRRLMAEPGLPGYARFAAMLIAANLSQILDRSWVLIHEVVAGALIALALALYRPGRPWAAMAVLAVAVAIRETVLPVAALLGCFALLDRDRRAAAAWLAFGLGALAMLAFHAAAVAAVTSPADLPSPGWSSFGGWKTYLAFVHHTSAIRALPAWITALLVPLALLGWAAWRSRLALIVLGVQLFFAALLMAVARSDNFYWAMMIVPTLSMGLIFAPAALAALARSLMRPRLPARA